MKASINDIGFASSIEDVTELQNQIQNIMLEANEMLMKKNPVTNPVTLLAARVAHAAQQATIAAQNVILAPHNMQLPDLLRYHSV